MASGRAANSLEMAAAMARVTKARVQYSFGAGVDVRTPIRVLFPISLRGEVRDYYSVSNPRFGTAVQGGGQHNVVASGGFVLSF